MRPIEELRLKAQLEDDFGLTRHGLSYSVAGQEPREVLLHDPNAKGPVRRATAGEGDRGWRVYTGESKAAR